MHPFALFLIVVAAGVAMVHGHSAVNTPTALFWEQTLPGSRMPDAIADLVRKGIDHSPLVEHHTAAISPRSSLSACALFDSTCSSQMVAETGIFFPMAQLRPGSTMTLSFPAEAEPAAILPHDVAEKAPFSNLDDVLSTFNIPSGSDEAARVRDTLTSCEAPPLAGVVKSCSTSLESTVQAATQMLGISTTNNHGVMAAAAPEIPRTGLPRQPYVVQAVTQLASDRYVSCHVMPFPYAVYLCHTTEKEPYGGFKVWLRGVGDEGPEVSLLAFCHMDTSRWNPAHPAFEVLHTRPGGSPVCHFTTYGSLAFVRKASTRA